MRKGFIRDGCIVVTALTVVTLLAGALLGIVALLPE
jgi:hypothetical protein